MSMYAGRPSSWRRHRVMDSGRMLKRRVSNGLLGSRSPCRSGFPHVGRCGEFGCGSPRLLVAITNGGEVVSGAAAEFVRRSSSRCRSATDVFANCPSQVIAAGTRHPFSVEVVEPGPPWLDRNLATGRRDVDFSRLGSSFGGEAPERPRQPGGGPRRRPRCHHANCQASSPGSCSMARLGITPLARGSAVVRPLGNR